MVTETIVLIIHTLIGKDGLLERTPVFEGEKNTFFHGLNVIPFRPLLYFFFLRIVLIQGHDHNT